MLANGEIDPVPDEQALVINTRDGTRRLRTGDVVRVDGSGGTVHVVAPVP